MKKLVFGLLIFLSVLAVMRIIALQFASASSVDIHPIAAGPTGQDFIPEFRDLPDLDTIDYPSDGAKLVDVFEQGSVYRESEVIAKPGETWLGLFEDDGKFSIDNTVIAIRHVPSGIGNSQAVSLKLSGSGIPVFIIKDLRAIKTVPVLSLYHRPSPEKAVDIDPPVEPMSIGYRTRFELGRREYTLRVTGGLTRNGSRVNVLLLETGGTTQVVTYNHNYSDHNTNYDSIGDLLWVGDIDSDGKADLYFSDFDYEKGYFSSNLFISSEAEPGALVKKVADFWTMGC